MGFIFDGLDTESYDREYSDRDLLRRIVSYFRPFGRKMALVALMLTLQSVAGSGRPIVIAKAIDQVAETPTIYRMAFAASLLLIFGAAAWVTNFIRQWLSARVVGDVVLQLRADALDATIRHDMPFFDKHPTGKIVSRVTSDTQAFSDVVGLVINLISQVLIIIIIIIWLFNINVGLTLLLLGMSPIAVVIALSFRRVARRVTQHARRVTAKINAQIQESISGIIVAKSFRKEQAIFETFEDNNQQAYHVGLRRGLTFNTIYPIMGVASGLATAMLVFAAGLRIQTSAISPGEWYLFNRLFLEPVPRWSIRRRAGVRFDRCRTRCRASSKRARRGARGPHRIQEFALQLLEKRDRPARFFIDYPSRRDARSCRSYGRREEQHRQIDHSLL